MKITLYTTLFILAVQLLSAQSFTEVPHFGPLIRVYAGSIAFADVDGDGDQDAVIAGNGFTKLYSNDGQGFLTEVTGTSFIEIRYGSLAFADVDNDGDQDILITGYYIVAPYIRLYLNDGLGHFSAEPGTPFKAVQNSALAFADIDSDGDQDVLITGRDATNVRSSTLYVNDGLGHFTELMGTPFIPVQDGSLAFADVDDDGDQDVLMTGNIGSDRISKLYRNDGSGNFTEVPGTPFPGVLNGSNKFEDVDNDGDQDVIITGKINNLYDISKLYLNDGQGNFTDAMLAPFEDTRNNYFSFADVDGDGDRDVVITPLSAGYYPSKLYLNDGQGHFTEVTGNPFVEVGNSATAFADVDGDGDQDLLITGWGAHGGTSKLYRNDGQAHFTEITGIPFTSVRNSAVAFRDVEGDGDLDLLITGENNEEIPESMLYVNDGYNHFEPSSVPYFEGLRFGAIGFSDVDNDGDQDALITGQNDLNKRESTLYLNDETGFHASVFTSFGGVDHGSVSFADIDHDGDPDVLLTGESDSMLIAKLYKNDGHGKFTETPGAPFDGVSTSAAVLIDLNGDNYADALITGKNNASESIAKLYVNDGHGNFIEEAGEPFEGVSESTVTCVDVDHDSDLDVLITGRNSSFEPSSKLYLNDGQGHFIMATNMPFTDVWAGSVAFADVNGDGAQDVLITGNNGTDNIAKLYLNDGSGQFNELTGTPFEGVSLGSVAFADVDGDNDQDVLITGQNDTGLATTKLYLNNTFVSPSHEPFDTRTDFDFTVFPNPAAADLNIQFHSDTRGLITFRMFDASGHLLRHMETYEGLGEQQIVLKLNSIPAGSYFIQLEDKQKIGRKLFVRQ